MENAIKQSVKANVGYLENFKGKRKQIMDSFIFLLWIFLPLLVLWTTKRKSRYLSVAIRKRLKSKRAKNKGEWDMLTLINGFIGKNCNVQTINQDYTGTIESVEDNWIVIHDKWYDTKEIVNLEYVTGIRLEKEKIKKAKKIKAEKEETGE